MDEHEQVCQLIPWYMNGTLDEREMDQVSAHLDTCSQCAAEVDREVALAKKMRHDPPGLEALMDRQPESLAALKQELARTGRFAQVGTPLERMAKPALAAAVVFALAVAFLAGRASKDDGYQLMSTNTHTMGPVVQIIFQPNAVERDIRHLLVDSGGALLGSPSGKGVYRVALPPGVDARAYAARLNQHPAVRWSELELR